MSCHLSLSPTFPRFTDTYSQFVFCSVRGDVKWPAGLSTAVTHSAGLDHFLSTQQALILSHHPSPHPSGPSHSFVSSEHTPHCLHLLNHHWLLGSCLDPHSHITNRPLGEVTNRAVSPNPVANHQPHFPPCLPAALSPSDPWIHPSWRPSASWTEFSPMSPTREALSDLLSKQLPPLLVLLYFSPKHSYSFYYRATCIITRMCVPADGVLCSFKFYSSFRKPGNHYFL